MWPCSRLAAFPPDAPWEITYDGILYLDQVLNCPTIRSTLTPFGLYLDLPVYHLTIIWSSRP